MSSEEERLKHSRRRKKNIMAKEINDRKGPFKIKVVDPRKPAYERVHLRVEDIYEEREENDTGSDGGVL